MWGVATVTCAAARAGGGTLRAAVNQISPLVSSFPLHPALARYSTISPACVIHRASISVPKPTIAFFLSFARHCSFNAHTNMASKDRDTLPDWYVILSAVNRGAGN